MMLVILMKFSQELIIGTWTEDQFVVTTSSGILNRDKRVEEITVRDLEKTKPDKRGCVQDHELWSPQEETTYVLTGRH